MQNNLRFLKFQIFLSNNVSKLIIYTPIMFLNMYQKISCASGPYSFSVTCQFNLQV
jgi:hypothetical protein